MSVKKIRAEELRRMNGQEGLILQGCGGELQDWVDGINDMLIKSDILFDGTKFKAENCLAFENEGLTNLLFPFSEDVKLNMVNSGCNELSTMGLVPSICSFLKLPCIPCDSTTILATENKKISNYVAIGNSIQTPKFLDLDNNYGIYRPTNLGNSIGIEKKHFTEFNKAGIYQEFIPGYDITIPVAYNYLTQELDILPPTLYFPQTHNPNWIFDEKTKEKDEGLTRLQFTEIEKETKCELLKLFRTFGIKTYGRIDVRLKEENLLSGDVVKMPFTFKNCYFLEINSMPTIESCDGFDLAFNAVLLNEKHSFYGCARNYVDNIKHPTINGFLLACSMLSLSTSKC